ncbi:MAG TPA: 4'-phosphopantetheinyl transferase superfamily protein, partial [Chroococcidiopsis sp.]
RVHVWIACLERSPADQTMLYGLLSADEQERATRFYFDLDRQRFIASRGLLRQILGRYLNCDPQAIAFSYAERGKPLLGGDGDSQAVQFNLSHSGAIALYAIGQDRRIGIDIEQIRPMPTADRLAQRFFSSREHAHLQTLDAPTQQRDFFRYWTCKEAYVKATGDGLALPVAQVEVLLDGDRPNSARFVSISGSVAEAKGWALHLLDPQEGYTGAIAVEGHDWDLRCWQMPATFEEWVRLG